MFRHALTVLAGVSLLLIAAVGALWLQSYFVETSVVRGEFQIDLKSGWLEAHRPPPMRRVAALLRQRVPPGSARNLVWQGGAAPRSATGAGAFVVRAHCGAVALPLTAFPALWLAVHAPARERSRRRVRGQCEWCSYDLRATPLRCPECGRVPVG